MRCLYALTPHPLHWKSSETPGGSLQGSTVDQLKNAWVNLARNNGYPLLSLVEEVAAPSPLGTKPRQRPERRRVEPGPSAGGPCPQFGGVVASGWDSALDHDHRDRAGAIAQKRAICRFLCSSLAIPESQSTRHCGQWTAAVWYQISLLQAPGTAALPKRQPTAPNHHAQHAPRRRCRL